MNNRPSYGVRHIAEDGFMRGSWMTNVYPNAIAALEAADNQRRIWAQVEVVWKQPRRVKWVVAPDLPIEMAWGQ